MKRVFFDHHKELMQVFLNKVSSPVLQTAEELTEMLYARHDVEDQHLAIDFGWERVEEYYRNTVIPHKIAVYDAGMGLLDRLHHVNRKKFQERLIVHDFSKFSCEEHIGYSQYDFKDKSKNSEKSKERFEKAWHHHKLNNDHHPEHWLSVNRDGTTVPLEMPNIAIYEMIADWIGAGKTYGSSLEEWAPKNVGSFLFHPSTAKTVAMLLNFLAPGASFFNVTGPNKITVS